MKKQIKKIPYNEFIGLPTTEGIADFTIKRLFDYIILAIRWLFDRMPKYYRDVELVSTDSSVVVTKGETPGWEVQDGKAIGRKFTKTYKIKLNLENANAVQNIINNIFSDNANDIPLPDEPTDPTEDEDAESQNGKWCQNFSVVTNVKIDGDFLKITTRRITFLGRPSGSLTATIVGLDDCPVEEI